MRARVALIALSFAIAPLGAMAVSLAADGAGQALIFPYYTVQANGPDAFNTLVSITNGSADAKAIKVRFREGRNSLVVAEFNVFLTPYDVWTGAVVPDGDGAKLVTADTSCVDPPFVNQALSLSNAAFASNQDGAGSDIGRLREGHFEAIEMGTLNAAGATALSQGCGKVTPAQVVAPSGGLRGGVSLINVNRGLDVTYNAEALAHLTTQAFYSAPGQPGTDFDSPEVTPVSNITTGNADFRLVWNRGIDAVTSLFMSAAISNDFVLDPLTNSHTDWIVTFPTRRFYVTPAAAQAPFTVPSLGGANVSCEEAYTLVYSREAFNPTSPADYCEQYGCAPPLPQICWASGALAVRNQKGASTSDVFASRNGVGGGTATAPFNRLDVYSNLQDGTYVLDFSSRFRMPPGLTSLPSSTKTDHTTGAVTTAAVNLPGLPVSGFMARTFENGNLACGSTVCQGNYSSAFRHVRIRGF